MSTNYCLNVNKLLFNVKLLSKCQQTVVYLSTNYWIKCHHYSYQQIVPDGAASKTSLRLGDRILSVCIYLVHARTIHMHTYMCTYTAHLVCSQKHTCMHKHKHAYANAHTHRGALYLLVFQILTLWLQSFFFYPPLIAEIIFYLLLPDTEFFFIVRA